MFSNLFPFLTTTHPQYVRHMDYLDETKAMKKRSERNRAAWQPHLEETRRFVLSAAEQCGSRKKVVVLGAGLLLDVPLQELSAMFEEVFLLDIVILPEVRRQVKTFENVKLIQHDVTNMAERLYKNVLQGIDGLPAAAPSVPVINENTSLVVSLNILSQLWVIPRAYVQSKIRGLGEEELNDWCRQIVESHYRSLASLSCPVCLVADHEFVKRDREGNVVSRGSTVYSLALPKPDTSWIWNIAPIGDDQQFLSKELGVGAWRLR